MDSAHRVAFLEKKARRALKTMGVNARFPVSASDFSVSTQKDDGGGGKPGGPDPEPGRPAKGGGLTKEIRAKIRDFGGERNERDSNPRFDLVGPGMSDEIG